MKLRKAVYKHIPLGITLLLTAGCVPPTPDYCCVRQKNAIYDRCRLNHNVELVNTELSLCDIVQIAIERNLDVQIQKLEESLQCEKVYAEKLKALPELDVNGDFTNRNNNPAWFSRTVNPPPVPNPEGKTNSRNTNPTPVGPLASQSTSRYHRDFDIAIAYSIIDFGLSFVRARQEKNRLCLLMQRNMRARQNLVLDVYRAYYRAIVAKQAVVQSQKLIGDLEVRQEQLQKQVEQQLVSEMTGLVNENRLIDMQVKLYAFENEYRSAMTELAALMGLPPGQNFSLTEMDIEDVSISDINIKELEDMAFHYRPELMAQDMQFHIDADEVRAILIQMFPNARIFAGSYHDDDRFMYNHDWWSIGANISWDLFRLPSQWSMEGAARFKKKVSWETRLSMSMGILTQVHLANINVQETNRQYSLAKDLFKVKERQLNVAKVLEQSGELSVDDVMVFEVEALFAEVNAVKAFANLQVALEQLSNAVGRPMRYSGLPEHCIPSGLEQCCAFPDAQKANPGMVKRSPSEQMNNHKNNGGVPQEKLNQKEEPVAQEQYYEDFLEKHPTEQTDAEPTPLAQAKDDSLENQEWFQEMYPYSGEPSKETPKEPESEKSEGWFQKKQNKRSKAPFYERNNTSRRERKRFRLFGNKQEEIADASAEISEQGAQTSSNGEEFYFYDDYLKQQEESDQEQPTKRMPSGDRPTIEDGSVEKPDEITMLLEENTELKKSTAEKRKTKGYAKSFYYDRGKPKKKREVPQKEEQSDALKEPAQEMKVSPKKKNSTYQKPDQNMGTKPKKKRNTFEKSEQNMNRLTKKAWRKQRFMGKKPSKEIADANLQNTEADLRMEQEQENITPTPPSPYIRDEINSMEDNSMESSVNLNDGPVMEGMQQEAESLNLNGGSDHFYYEDYLDSLNDQNGVE